MKKLKLPSSYIPDLCVRPKPQAFAGRIASAFKFASRDNKRQHETGDQARRIGRPSFQPSFQSGGR